MRFKFASLIVFFILIMIGCDSIQRKTNLNTHQGLKHVLVGLQSGYDTTMISAVLSCDKSVYKKGEIPIIKSEIVNNTNNRIYLVESLDGSCDFMRFPIFKYYVYGNDSLVTPSNTRCGQVDGLPDDAFVRLGPGDSFDPNSSYSWVYRDQSVDSGFITQSGKYKINFYYSTAQDTLDKWVGWDTHLLNEMKIEEKTRAIEKLKKKFKQVPKISLYSNTIEFIIK